MRDMRYLEIVTNQVDAVCAAYCAVNGLRFGEPDAGLGDARMRPCREGPGRSARAPARVGRAGGSARLARGRHRIRGRRSGGGRRRDRPSRRWKFPATARSPSMSREGSNTACGNGSGAPAECRWTNRRRTTIVAVAPEPRCAKPGGPRNENQRPTPEGAGPIPASASCWSGSTCPNITARAIGWPRRPARTGSAGRYRRRAGRRDRPPEARRSPRRAPSSARASSRSCGGWSMATRRQLWSSSTTSCRRARAATSTKELGGKKADKQGKKKAVGRARAWPGRRPGPQDPGPRRRRQEGRGLGHRPHRADPRHLRHARAHPAGPAAGRAGAARSTCCRGWCSCGRTSSGRPAASARAAPARRSSRPTAASSAAASAHLQDGARGDRERARACRPERRREHVHGRRWSATPTPASPR